MSGQTTSAAIGGSPAETQPVQAPAAVQPGQARAVELAVVKAVQAGRKPVEFDLVLADGKRRTFRITSRGVARFERRAGKTFGGFDVSSVADLGDLLTACEWHGEEREADVFTAALLRSLVVLDGAGRGSLLDLIPLEEKPLYAIQLMVMRAVSEVRGTRLPDSLLEQAREELGQLPWEKKPGDGTQKPDGNGSVSGAQVVAAGAPAADKQSDTPAVN